MPTHTTIASSKRPVVATAPGFSSLMRFAANAADIRERIRLYSGGSATRTDREIAVIDGWSP